MQKFLRFRDLQSRGIVNSWPALRHRIDHAGFPPGRKLGSNTRAWTEQEIELWLATRSSEKKLAPRRRKADQAEAAS